MPEPKPEAVVGPARALHITYNDDGTFEVEELHDAVVGEHTGDHVTIEELKDLTRRKDEYVSEITMGGLCEVYSPVPGDYYCWDRFGCGDQHDGQCVRRSFSWGNHTHIWCLCY
jgi:hypothetical protein